MRPTATALVLVLVLVAGCGGGDDEPARSERAGAGADAAAPAATAVAVPSPPPAPTPRISSEVRRRLADGEAGVVDFEFVAGVAPSRLRPNKDQTLSGLDWTGWGEPRTTGRGEVRTLECDPSCAQGLAPVSDATLTLSAARVCGRRRFYSEGRLEYEDEGLGRRRTARVYLRTPC